MFDGCIWFNLSLHRYRPPRSLWLSDDAAMPRGGYRNTNCPAHSFLEEPASHHSCISAPTAKLQSPLGAILVCTATALLAVRSGEHVSRTCVLFPTALAADICCLSRLSTFVGCSTPCTRVSGASWGPAYIRLDLRSWKHRFVYIDVRVTFHQCCCCFFVMGSVTWHASPLDCLLLDLWLLRCRLRRALGQNGHRSCWWSR